MPKTKTIRAWVKLGTQYIEGDIEVPEDCFDEDGNIIESDAIEFVEVWINEKLHMEYGTISDPIKPQ